MDRTSTPIPKRMRTLEKDARGYPIPFIVLRDKTKQPQFTINDHQQVWACISKKLCSICGKKLEKEMWFVGGSRCFLHPRGGFVDPAMHLECAEYALQVCPFLAMPTYNKRIDDRKMPPEKKPDDLGVVVLDYMNPRRPERLGLGSCTEFRTKGSRLTGDLVLVVDQWNYVEWWKDGERTNAPDEPVPKDETWTTNQRPTHG